ncbi:MAG TPA: HAD family hydrolase, partial [Spirochaetota bacterium]|nr:HAD family hydrolase [Spirochaetota bacterium]
TENEFTSKIMRDGNIEYDIPIEEMNTTYNHDKYNPLDGIMLKGCDDLAAFIEASLSIKYGIKPEALENGRRSIYDKYKSRKIGNLDFGMVFDYFN